MSNHNKLLFPFTSFTSSIEGSTQRILSLLRSVGTRAKRCFLEKVFEEVPKNQVTSLQGAMHCRHAHAEEAGNTEEEDGENLTAGPFDFSQPIGGLDFTGLTNKSKGDEEEEKDGTFDSSSSRDEAQALATTPRI